MLAGYGIIYLLVRNLVRLFILLNTRGGGIAFYEKGALFRALSVVDQPLYL